jgi:hypothetical protein
MHKDIAEPLRFRSLRFDFPLGMSTEEIDAQEPVLEVTSEMHTKVARWTRQIWLDSDDGYIPEFSRIIRHAVKLRLLGSLFLLQPEFIEALADTAGHTLQELNTVVGAGYLENESAFWTPMTRLRELRTLTLFIIAAPNEVTLNVMSVQEMPVLNLPRLELFTLEDGRGIGIDADSQIFWLTWLSRCRFPKLRDVCFGFDRFPVHHGQFLIEFLNAHDGIHGLRLERRLVDPPNLLAVLPFVHVPHLSLSLPPNSPEFLKFLTADVRELVIGLDVTRASQCSHLWEILDDMVEKPASHCGLQCLVFERPFEDAPGPLLWNYTEVMLWYSHELEAYVSAMGRLVLHALRFRKVGIQLLDEYGMGIASVQNQVNGCFHCRRHRTARLI